MIDVNKLHDDARTAQIELSNEISAIMKRYHLNELDLELLFSAAGWIYNINDPEKLAASITSLYYIEEMDAFVRLVRKIEGINNMPPEN